MGRDRKGKIARGVRIRTYASGKQALQIQFQYRGIPCRETLSTMNPQLTASQRYAVNLKAEIEARIERGSFVYTDYFPDSPRARMFGHVASTLTVKDAQAALIADLEAAGRESTTIDSYRKSASRIDDHIGHIRVSDLTPGDIRDMFRRRQVKRKTWNNDLIPLRSALDRAINDSIIQFSPLDRVKMNELVPKHKPPKPDPFTLAEIEAILATAADYCPRAWNIYEFLFFSGLRLEEMAALLVPDIDLAGNKVYVTKAAQLSLRSTETKEPKTEAGERAVDLLPRARAAVKRQLALTRWRGENVFTQENTLQPIRTYNQLRRRFVTVCKRADVRYRPLKQARHTYASHMLSSGQRDLYVAHQIGHKGTSLLEVYATWVDEWKDQYGEVRYGT